MGMNTLMRVHRAGKGHKSMQGAGGVLGEMKEELRHLAMGMEMGLNRPPPRVSASITVSVPVMVAVQLALPREWVDMTRRAHCIHLGQLWVPGDSTAPAGVRHIPAFRRIRTRFRIAEEAEAREKSEKRMGGEEALASALEIKAAEIMLVKKEGMGLELELERESELNQRRTRCSGKSSPPFSCRLHCNVAIAADCRKLI